MLRLATLLIAAVCVAPLLLVLASWLAALPPQTADNWQHIRHTLLNGYLLQTLYLCVGVALVCGVFGTLAAWLTAHYSFTGSRVLAWAMILPLAMPGYISAYAYGWLLDYAGPVQFLLRETMEWTREDYAFMEIRSLGGAIWILGLATTPYVYMLARAAFLSQPQEWWEASATLGAYSTRFFRRIALPAARPFIATGIALALMESLADIGTVSVLGVHTLSTGIYRSWFFMGEPLLAARLAGFLLLFVFVLMGMEALGRRRMRYSSQRPQHGHATLPLKGRAAIGAMLLCAIPVLGGFVLPLVALVRLALYTEAGASLSTLPLYGWHTLQLGATAGAITCLAALLMVCAERFHTGWLRFITLFANLGYAIPGAVLAVGILMLFGGLREWAGLQWAITGSLTGLLIAYAVRFMATAYSPLHSGMVRISTELDMAAASLGKSRMQTMLRVHLPLLRLPLCVGFLLVFLDTVKELPATLILRPFDVKPLAVSVYEFAGDDRYILASPYALALVAIATCAVVALHRVQHRILRERYVEG